MRVAIPLAILLAASCDDPAPTTSAPAPMTTEATSEPASPAAPNVFEIRPPSSRCAVVLVRDDAGARIATRVEAGDTPIACFDGPSAPDPAAVTTERVDVLADGDGGCGRRVRFTFRHDGIVVRTRCPDDGTLVVDAESTRGTRTLTTLDRAANLEVTVPWAGDWDDDGRLEWIVRIRDGETARYLGAFSLRDDDTIALLAEHR